MQIIAKYIAWIKEKIPLFCLNSIYNLTFCIWLYVTVTTGAFTST